jgi:hypothetical protein
MYDLDFSALRTRTEMDLETSVFSSFNHLTRLVAREDFIIHYYILLRSTFYMTQATIFTYGEPCSICNSCTAYRYARKLNSTDFFSPDP